VRIYFNYIDGILSPVAGTSRLTSFTVKRRDAGRMEVVPLKYNAQGELEETDLPPGAVLKLIVKARGEFRGDTLAEVVSWSTPSSHVYSGALIQDTEKVATAFAAGESEKASVAVAMEVVMIIGTAETTASAVPGTMENDYFDGEDDPVVSLPGYPAAAQLPIIVTGGHAGLRAIPTAGGLVPNNRVFLCLGASAVAEFWAWDSAATAADDDALVIRASDYDGVTNPGNFERVG
jgi:hypothetical protein